MCNPMPMKKTRNSQFFASTGTQSCQKSGKNCADRKQWNLTRSEMLLPGLGPGSQTESGGKDSDPEIRKIRSGSGGEISLSTR
uniref:Uncharacterized protein n=1 Tax=Panagrellus redivivus TaxID=6233 RepID=A0A7E4W6Y6_PANRE